MQFNQCHKGLGDGNETSLSGGVGSGKFEEDVAVTDPSRERARLEDGFVAQSGSVVTTTSSVISGVVLNTQGDPAPGIEVCYLESWRGEIGNGDVTDSEGRFSIDFSESAFSWSGQSEKILRLSSGNQVFWPHRIQLDPRGRELRVTAVPMGVKDPVRVLDGAAGIPRPGVPLRLSGSEYLDTLFMTDGDGIALTPQRADATVERAHGVFGEIVGRTRRPGHLELVYEGVPYSVAFRLIDSQSGLTIFDGSWREARAKSIRLHDDSEPGVLPPWTAAESPRLSTSCKLLIEAPGYVPKWVSWRSTQLEEPAIVELDQIVDQDRKLDLQVSAFGTPVDGASIVLHGRKNFWAESRSGDKLLEGGRAPGDSFGGKLVLDPITTGPDGIGSYSISQIWGLLGIRDLRVEVSAPSETKKWFRIPKRALDGRSAVELELHPAMASVVFQGHGLTGESSIDVWYDAAAHAVPVDEPSSRAVIPDLTSNDLTSIGIEMKLLPGTPFRWRYRGQSTLGGDETPLSPGELRVIEVPFVEFGEISGQVLSEDRRSWQGRALTLWLVGQPFSLEAEEQASSSWRRANVSQGIFDEEDVGNFLFSGVPRGEYQIVIAGAEHIGFRLLERPTAVVIGTANLELVAAPSR